MLYALRVRFAKRVAMVGNRTRFRLTYTNAVREMARIIRKAKLEMALDDVDGGWWMVV